MISKKPNWLSLISRRFQFHIVQTVMGDPPKHPSQVNEADQGQTAENHPAPGDQCGQPVSLKVFKMVAWSRSWLWG